MKCVIGFLLFSVCALHMISASPVQRNGMVFYQPDYYNAHRAFVMQYASQPVKYYRRNGQASGVTAYASGKKIATGTYIKQAELVDEEDEQTVDESHDQLDGGAQSTAVAYPVPDTEEEEEEEEEAAHNKEEESDSPTPPQAVNDVREEEAPETPVRVVPTNNKKTQVHLVDEDDDEEETPVRSRNRGTAGATYFPVTFGSTNGGAIAIANSYSTGKGGSASSRATAYGSAAKPKQRIAHQ